MLLWCGFPYQFHMCLLSFSCGCGRDTQISDLAAVSSSKTLLLEQCLFRVSTGHEERTAPFLIRDLAANGLHAASTSCSLGWYLETPCLLSSHCLSTTSPAQRSGTPWCLQPTKPCASRNLLRVGEKGPVIGSGQPPGRTPPCRGDPHMLGLLSTICLYLGHGVWAEPVRAMLQSSNMLPVRAECRLVLSRRDSVSRTSQSVSVDAACGQELEVLVMAWIEPQGSARGPHTCQSEARPLTGTA